MTPEHFLTHSLQNFPHGPRVARILSAAIQAVEPGAAVERFLRREGDTLFVNGRPYQEFERVFLVGAGKASVPMAEAVVNILGDKLTKGLVITKTGQAGEATRIGPVELLEAGHPLPTLAGVAGGQRMASLLAQTGKNDLVLVVISGGGSALLTQPVVSLDDLRTLTDQLLACGATIHEINTLRKHLDTVKGGGLARIASPARVAALILSDVVGNPLDIIASGPTVSDPSTFADVEAILRKYDLWETIPPAIRTHLEQGLAGEIPDTPKPDDPLFDRVQNVLVGSNELAANAAREEAELEGFWAEVVTTDMQGEASEKGDWILETCSERGRRIGRLKSRPACLIFGGETTVTLGGSMKDVGKGGRNQEMALAVVRKMAEIPNAMFVTLATDGGDGPTDAAGAVVTSETLSRAEIAGLKSDDFLARHDAYHFFDPLGDLLRPGPTQTNVNDLAFLFLF
ncbi:MAG TPA: glycerate kinase [Anaerolineales bacterium]|nr:glycerate kinase [Anaerolineales bacterium]